MKKNLVLICRVLLLMLVGSGCSSITYKEPESGPKARVRFATDSESVTTVRSYSSTKCDNEQHMMGLRKGFLLNPNEKQLGIPLWDYHKNAAKEVFVTANIPQIYLFASNKEIYYMRNQYLLNCGVFIKQQFEAGKDYEISYKWDNNKCFAEISEIKLNSSGNYEKVLLQKRGSELTNDFSKICFTYFNK